MRTTRIRWGRRGSDLTMSRAGVPEARMSLGEVSLQTVEQFERGLRGHEPGQVQRAYRLLVPADLKLLAFH